MPIFLYEVKNNGNKFYISLYEEQKTAAAEKVHRPGNIGRFH